jgi:hypothetical protein
MPPAAGPAERAGLSEGKPFERRRRHRAAPPSLCACARAVYRRRPSAAAALLSIGSALASAACVACAL